MTAFHENWWQGGSYQVCIISTTIVFPHSDFNNDSANQRWHNAPRVTSWGWGETAKYCIIRPSHVPPESGLCYEPDSLGVKSIEKVRIDVKMNRSCFHIYSYLAMVFYTQWIWFITQTTLWRDVGGANNTEHGALASTLSSNTWCVTRIWHMLV